MSVPEEYRDLLDRPIVAVLATIRPDGTPHAVPVWVEYDDEDFLVVTREGGQKHRNLEHAPDVTLTLVDPENQYRYLMVRGEVSELTEDGAFDVLDRLTRRYWGVEEYPDDRDAPRILARIRPVDVHTQELDVPAGT